MRARTAVSVALAGVLAAGAAAPSLAATRKPRPIKGSFVATGIPDPSPALPEVGTDCEPTLPSAKTEKAFTVPAKGYLHVAAKNALDWSIAVVTEDGEILGCADGGQPQDVEALDVTFKRRTKVLLRASNFAGEPQVTVDYVFTFR